MKKSFFSMCMCIVMLFSLFFVVNAELNNSEIINHKIKIGDYVILGRYNNESILWRCIDIDENGPLMLSDEILCEKVYDQVGINRTGSHAFSSLRTVHTDNYFGDCGGSNFWGDSNIRCWLNSASEDVLYTCGNPPDDVNSGYNGGKEPGFLSEHNFSETEKNLIKPVTLKNLLSKADFSQTKHDFKRTIIYDWPYDLAEMQGIFSKYHMGFYKYDLPEYYNDIIYKNFTDRVFLLAPEQMLKITKNSDVLGEYDKAKDANGNLVDYFLRTPDLICHEEIRNPYADYPYQLPTEYHVFTVNSRDDEINGYKGSGVRSSLPLGIRPAFYVDTEKINSINGAGTSNDPYYIDVKIQKDICISLDDVLVKLQKKAFLYNDRVYVSVDDAAECFDADLNISDTEKIEISDYEHKIVFDKNSKSFISNGKETETDAYLLKDNGVFYVPLRYVCEAFYAFIEWNGDFNQVCIKREFGFVVNKFHTYDMVHLILEYKPDEFEVYYCSDLFDKGTPLKDYSGVDVILKESLDVMYESGGDTYRMDKVGVNDGIDAAYIFFKPLKPITEDTYIPFAKYGNSPGQFKILFHSKIDN